MKQFQWRSSISASPYGPFDLERAVNDYAPDVDSREQLDALQVGATWKDRDGDLWERLPDKSEAGQLRVEHGPGETIFYVPADRLERIATAVTEGMVNTIRTEDDYQRIRAMAADRGMSVSQWIACDAVKQAHALITELDKQA